MHPEIFNILKLRKSFYKIILSTNGLLINKNNINSIAENIDFIIISAENLFENQSLVKWLDNCINELHMRNIEVALSYVVTKKNIERAIDFLDYCNYKNVDISLKIVAPIGKAYLNNDILLKERDVNSLYNKIYDHFLKKEHINTKMHNFLFPTIRPKLSCSAGNKTISINSTGDVFICHSLEEDSFKYGNLLDEENTTKKLFKDIDLSFLNFSDNLSCYSCEVKYFCGGNCYAERINGGSNRRDNCMFFKRLIVFSLFNYDKTKSSQENLNNFITIINQNKDFEVEERCSWNELLKNR